MYFRFCIQQSKEFYELVEKTLAHVTASMSLREFRGRAAPVNSNSRNFVARITDEK